ncbi:MAG: hypothetical protein M3301_09375, partial [Chloroflexota bacterium]|nr:hypothetical protein [Chloroflexota bacterium]
MRFPNRWPPRPALACLLGLLSIAALATAGAPRVLAAPGNDNFADAFVLEGEQATATASNVGASGESGEPLHTDWAAPLASIWYAWTAPSTATYRIDTCDSDFHSILAVYTGSSLSTLRRVVNSQSAAYLLCTEQRGAVTFPAVEGTTYRIAVDGSEANTGSVSLRLQKLTDVPPNDHFANAHGIPAEGGTVTGTNTNATAEAGEPDHSSNPPFASLWYRWTAASDVNVTVDACASDYDTALAVYTGNRLDALELVARDGGWRVCSGSHQSFLKFSANAGTTYSIAVDGSSWGTVVMKVQISSAFPANDRFRDAEPVSGYAVSVSGTTAGASAEQGEPAHTGDTSPLTSVWYRWIAPGDVFVRLATCNTGYIGRLAVYVGSSVDALRRVDSTPDGTYCDYAINFHAAKGTTYSFAVDGWSSSTGPFELRLASYYRLSATVLGTGSGTIEDPPFGLGCAWYWQCSSTHRDYLAGSSVTITATPERGSSFEGWGGDCSGLEASCTLVMDAHRSISATFTLQSYPLNVQLTGSGEGTVTSVPAGIDCGSDCSQTYPYGTDVTLRAAPAGPRFVFREWGGACRGTYLTCTVTIQELNNVTAQFDIRLVGLNVGVTYGSWSKVVSEPAGIDCGIACGASYEYGTTVTLTAIPTTGTAFLGWEYDCSGTGPCVLLMDRERRAFARFAPIRVSANSPQIVEPDVGTANLVFTVQLNTAARDPVSVDYSTADLTAVAGTDYSARSGTLTFTPGETQKTVPVPVIADLVDEPDESIHLSLLRATNASLAHPGGVGIIRDNDPPPALRVTDAAAVTELDYASVYARFTVTLGRASAKTVSVRYATANGSAAASVDYGARSGILTFNPGQTAKTIWVPVYGDLRDEYNESFYLNLSAPTNATIGDGQGRGIVYDDDPLPSLRINDV